ncbi:MAG: peptidylprolyl isomerase [Pseudobdellovibrio sp.]
MKKLFSLFLSLCTFSSITLAKENSSARTEVVDKIIAVVSSEAILQSDLNDFSLNINKEGTVDDSLLLDEKIADLKSSRANQLQYLVREKLVQSEIKRQNLSFTDEKINQEMDNLAKRNRMNRSDLETYIKKQGFSLETYKQILKARMERQSFFESEIISKLRITDEDAYNEYKIKNPNAKTNVNEFKISQIFFNPKKGSPEEALKRAEAVLKKVEAGERFDALANKYTEDKSANDGGFLGHFKSGEFNSELEKAIVNLDAGATTNIVQSKSGFHILKVIEKKVSYDNNFLKIKEQIKASLIEQNFKRQLKNWFESKKQEAYIKIYE